MNLAIYTVFHKALDERLIWAQFSADEIARYFTPYAVNLQVAQKRLVNIDGKPEMVDRPTPRIVVEHHLDWHDPALQARGFMETSCYVHVLRNRLHETFDFVGVTQYDMRWSAPAAAMLRALAGADAPAERTVAAVVCGPLVDERGNFHRHAFADLFDWNYLLASYNRFFKRGWRIEILLGKPLTLYQTYILPRSEFVALASWLEALCAEVYPWANQPPHETHWGVLGGYTERAEALFIAARLHEGGFALQHLPVEHDPSIAARLGVSKKHYG
jgi:hypothetical protein